MSAFYVTHHTCRTPSSKMHTPAISNEAIMYGANEPITWCATYKADIEGIYGYVKHSACKKAYTAMSSIQHVRQRGHHVRSKRAHHLYMYARMDAERCR